MQHVLDASIPRSVCAYSRRSHSISPDMINTDDTYTDVRLPFGWKGCRLPSLFRRPSHAYDNVESPSANIGLGSGDHRAALGPLPSGSELRMNVKYGASTLWAPTSADHVGPPEAGCRRRSMRMPTVQALLPAEDRLLPNPAADAPGRRRQVRRARVPGWVFEYGFTVIMRLRSEDLRLDHGGVSGKRIFLLSHEMSGESHGLFEYSPRDRYTLQINLALGVNPEHFD
ncbi:hypothetical protein BJY52DRAFT_1419416 [Lactarius psammicola]|nr:hypothetical protein BJY52DRAFT_1419416 [Lactarius psammicola]